MNNLISHPDCHPCFPESPLKSREWLSSARRSKRFALLAVVILACPSLPGQDTEVQPETFATNSFVIDSMDDLSKNALGGRNAIYMMAPSWLAYSKAEDYGKSGGGLKITYDKKYVAGPHGGDSVCGYYTIVKRGSGGYLDGSPYRFLTFWVRGDKGNEKFKVGVADKRYAAMDDSVKSQEVGAYLSSGRITQGWQLAVVPMSDFNINWSETHSITFCIEADLFVNGAGSGTFYIDELMLVKQRPTPTQ